MLEGDGEPVLYENIKSYISYYDWKLVRGEQFNFINVFHRYGKKLMAKKIKEILIEIQSKSMQD